MRQRLWLTAAIAAAATLALTACGTTESATTSPAAAATTAQAITLTDGAGRTVTLDGPATKVVGTEWNVVESLVSLGVDPVGVADVKGYGIWDSAVPLRTTPKDIGTRGEPSLDTIAALAPDLIVATTDLPAASVTQLKKIAPVLQVRSANGTDQIGQMLGNVDLIAKATGTEAKATALRTAFTAKIASGRAAIAAAGLSGTKFAFADGYVQANQVGIRPYAKGSLIGDITTQLGLTNAWTVAGDKDYGLAGTDVEGLTKLGDVQFLYIVNSQDGGDPFAEVLGKNKVWKSLAFVKAGHVHRLPDGIWLFGGPGAMSAYIDGVVSALTT
jgi:iron complex transport system substrate-binding protein